MIKKHFWLIIGGAAVLISIYCFVFYKFADPSGLPTPTDDSSSTSSVPRIKDISALFTILEKEELVQTTVLVEKWSMIFSISSEKSGAPYNTEVIVTDSKFDSGKDEEFFVIHNIAFSSNLPIHGPFRGNLSSLIGEVQKLKPGQILATDFKVQSVNIPENTTGKIGFEKGVVRVEKDKSGKKFIIKRDDKIIKEVAVYEGEGPVDYLDILKTTPDNVYIGRYLESMPGESRIYKQGPTELFVLNLKDNSIKDIALNQGGTVVAITPSESTLLYIIQREEKVFLAMRSLVGYSEGQFSLPGGYSQFGDFQVSPDGKNLVYGAVKGTKGQQGGAVFIIRGMDKFANKESILITETKEPNTYFKINGWKNNNQPDYQLIEI